MTYCMWCNKLLPHSDKLFKEVMHTEAALCGLSKVPVKTLHMFHKENMENSLLQSFSIPTKLTIISIHYQYASPNSLLQALVKNSNVDGHVSRFSSVHQSLKHACALWFP
jgi:hypothetical protein